MILALFARTVASRLEVGKPTYHHQAGQPPEQEVMIAL